MLWAKIVQQFHPKNPKSLALRTHCQTSGWSLTEQDPFNNVARTTVEAMAAAFGGTQSIHTNALDEAIALPTDFSAHIAKTHKYTYKKKTHHQNSRSLGRKLPSRAIDRRYCEQRMETNSEVETLGGMTKAIEQGIPKMRIEEAAAKKQAKIDSGQDIIVGVNKYQLEEEDPLHILEVDNEAVRTSQIERLNQLKSDRDSEKVAQSLTHLEEAAKTGNGNLLDLAVKAARHRATLGEISNALETVFGRHKAVHKTISGVYRKEIKDNKLFREASTLADQFAALEGRRPRIMIAKLARRSRQRSKSGGDRICRSWFRCRYRSSISNPSRSGQASYRKRCAYSRNIIACSRSQNLSSTSYCRTQKIQSRRYDGHCRRCNSHSRLSISF